jgi:hypothetical protein
VAAETGFSVLKTATSALALQNAEAAETIVSMLRTVGNLSSLKLRLGPAEADAACCRARKLMQPARNADARGSSCSPPSPAEAADVEAQHSASQPSCHSSYITFSVNTTPGTLLSWHTRNGICTRLSVGSSGV